jgi:hypothetical protein
MSKLIFFITLIFLTINVFAQEEKNKIPEINASFGSYVSSGNDLPFWLVSNQNGIFTMKNRSYQLFQLGLEPGLKQDSLKKWDITYGTNLVYGYAGASDFQVNQYWAGARYKWLVMKLGAQPDPVLYAGLSSTNGNMDWSNNARPLPGVAFSTDGFIPFFFWKKWFSVKAFYAEYLLFDNQYVDNAHLHHKYAYTRASLDSWKISLGLDHWVWWGGTSPDLGKLPGFENYFRYIFGLRGGSNSPETDKENVSGNSLGLYLLTIEKKYRDFSLTFYYNHPFEDRSGLEMANIPDGLWGLYYHHKNSRTFLNDVVYEFQNTTNQSGTYADVEIDHTGIRTGRGNDNYFNHGVYKSGHIYYNRMMGTPVFIPVIGANGISQGFDNTRIWLHHLGLSGWLNERMSWKSYLTWSRSFGTYNPNGMFPHALDELSFLAECSYSLKQIPLKVNAGIAGDYGERFESRLGGYAGISWRLR